MGEKILTIAIPTYNRAETLRLLLNILLDELEGLKDSVEVIISDNASSDQTSEVTKEFSVAWPAAVVVRHDNNLGAEENFCQCVDRVRTRYFWLLGDDDLPKKGAVRKIVDLIEAESPDLVYLHSEWSREIACSGKGDGVVKLDWLAVSQINFARLVNVWFTFISGMIVNRERLNLFDNSVNIRHYAGTGLVQLGWIFALLKSGRSFIYVDTVCVLAKGGNSGGYAIVDVFCENFTHIVEEALAVDSLLSRVIIRRNIVGYLPRLVWGGRFSGDNRFHDEKFWSGLKRRLSGYPFFWLILTPISIAPRALALPFLLVAMIINRLLQALDRLRSNLPCLFWTKGLPNKSLR